MWAIATVAPIAGHLREGPADRPSPTERVGVFVLGMHRGGTSALSRTIGLLGVPMGEAGEIKGPSPINPRGFWELKSLTTSNDRVLAALGGDWSSPPRMPPGWHCDPRLAELRPDARMTVERVLATPQWVWKDPRNCLTLPFWAELLEARTVAVVVYRNPLEIWRSLERRDGFSKLLSLALWERYLRSALSAAERMPVAFVRYADLLDDPRRTVRDLRAFLLRHGVACPEDGQAAIGEFLEAGLRHASYDHESLLGDADLSVPQRQLAVAVDAMPAEHDHFEEPPLPSPTPVGDALFEEGRRRLAALQAARAERTKAGRKTKRDGKREGKRTAMWRPQ